MIISGFFMSIQFTGYNTIAYDEVSQERMGAATSFYTTFQQLMLSLGICVAALALHSSMLVRVHAHAELNDFSAAFIVVTMISLTATIWNARFSRTAGAEMSGYKGKKGAIPADH
jgi:hypothetical protein